MTPRESIIIGLLFSILFHMEGGKMRQIRNVFKLSVTLILALFINDFAQATVIDFEGLGTEGTIVTNVPGAPEVTISGGVLVVPGNPRTAFNGNSSGSGPGGIDDALSGNTLKSVSNGSTVVFTFSTDIKDLQFYVADIETGTVTEVFEARVYDAGNNLLHTITLTGGDPGTGDGLLALADFSTGFTGSDSIRKLEFEAITAPSALPGYAVDNFSYSVIPIPPAVWLFGSGLIGLIGVARRKKS